MDNGKRSLGAVVQTMGQGGASQGGGSDGLVVPAGWHSASPRLRAFSTPICEGLFHPWPPGFHFRYTVGPSLMAPPRRSLFSQEAAQGLLTVPRVPLATHGLFVAATLSLLDWVWVLDGH